MFCIACATHNPETLLHCGGCGVRLSRTVPETRHTASRAAGSRLFRVARWLRIVPAAALLFVVAGFGSSAVQQHNRLAQAYTDGNAALIRGETAEAIDAFGRAGTFRDADIRLVELQHANAPLAERYDAATDALAIGDFERAIDQLTAIVRDDPRYRDASSLLDEAHERRRAALALEVDIATSRHDWLRAEELLSLLLAESPDDQELRERLDDIRRYRTPVLYTSEGEIVLASPDGSDGRLVLDGVEALSPNWSPDRSRIAFYTQVEDTVIAFNLWIINRDGTGLRQIADHVYPGWFVAWSPDSTRVAFVRQLGFDLNGLRGLTSIQVADVETGVVTDLTRHVLYQPLAPSWSADGTRVVFISKIMYGHRATVTWRQAGSVYMADLATGALTDVTGGELPYVEYVSWSPAGNRLLLWTNEIGSSWSDTSITTIHLMELDTGEIEEITDRSRAVSRPIWSPDGQRYAYVDGDQVVQVRTVTGAVTTLTLSGPVFTMLTWSPDSAWLLVPSARPQTGSAIMPIRDGTAGTGEFPLVYDLSGDLVGPPRWSGGWPVDDPAALTVGGSALDA